MKTLQQLRVFLGKEAAERKKVADREWNRKGHTNKFDKMMDESKQCVYAAAELTEIIRPK